MTHISLRLTARHSARLAARRRVKEILEEQAQLLALYPELRDEVRSPDVVRRRRFTRIHRRQL
jgi:hypothetical protein